jgi:hypothetical protein
MVFLTGSKQKKDPVKVFDEGVHAFCRIFRRFFCTSFIILALIRTGFRRQTFKNNLDVSEPLTSNNFDSIILRYTLTYGDGYGIGFVEYTGIVTTLPMPHALRHDGYLYDENDENIVYRSHIGRPMIIYESETFSVEAEESFWIVSRTTVYGVKYIVYRPLSLHHIFSHLFGVDLPNNIKTFGRPDNCSLFSSPLKKGEL